MLWRKFNGEVLNEPSTMPWSRPIRRETAAGYRLKVCIGTDSQVKGQETEYATVIVFLREGHGGFMFIHNERTRQHISIKERMLLEVAKSIENRLRAVQPVYPLQCRHGSARRHQHQPEL
jgi:hypothetical protein